MVFCHWEFAKCIYDFWYIVFATWVSNHISIAVDLLLVFLRAGGVIFVKRNAFTKHVGVFLMQGVWPFVSWFLRILYWKVSSAGASKIGFGVGRQLFVSIFLQIFQCN